jgi:hypothetical protein
MFMVQLEPADGFLSRGLVHLGGVVGLGGPSRTVCGREISVELPERAFRAWEDLTNADKRCGVCSGVLVDAAWRGMFA